MHRWYLVVLLLLAAAAPGRTARSLTQYDITWYFDADYTAGKFANGDWWVLGPVVIDSITPHFDGDNHGWEINPASITLNGFDSGIKNFTVDLVPSLPCTVTGTASVVKAVSLIPDERFYKLKTAAVLTVVETVPAHAGSLAFRPPYFGTEKRCFSLADLRLDLLPELPPTVSAPGIPGLIPQFQRVQMDHIWQDPGRRLHPKENMPEYGRDIAFRNNGAYLRMMLDDTPEEKMPLLVHLVQYGIDLYGMRKGGVHWGANGGHSVGRRLPFVFASVMLNDGDMKAQVRDAPENIFDELQSVYRNRTNTVLYGQFNDAETYWGRMATWPTGDQLSGSKTIRDPHGYIDGGPIPGESYELLLVQGWKGAVTAVALMPALRPVWNDAELVAFTDRWVAVGTWASPDPCAPPVFMTAAEWKSGRVDSGYGITWGPAPGNLGDCHMTQSCDCIRDLDSSDGIGRFPEQHGAHRDAGQVPDAFVREMYDSYRTREKAVDAPMFSPRGGYYDDSVMVTIVSATDDARIYYSLDGSDPDTTSPVYTVPVKMKSPALLKSRAFKNDHIPSFISSDEYDVIPWHSLVLDNDQHDMICSTSSSGTWLAADGVPYRKTGVFADRANSWCAWDVRLPVTGPFDVQMYWPDDGGQAFVQVKILEDGVLKFIDTLDQRINTEQWNSISPEITFNSTGVKVIINPLVHGKNAVADGLAFRYKAPAAIDGMYQYKPEGLKSGLIDLYPNPMKRYVQIRIHESVLPEEASISIYNRRGMLIWNRNVPGTDRSVEWTGLNSAGKEEPPGLYPFVYTCGSRRWHGKIMKTE